jgi:heat shock protein HtpX
VKIRQIRAQNFLSFENFELELDPELTVIVGPNGSGKTNLARAFRLVREVLRAAARMEAPPACWRETARLGSGQPGFKVGLDLEFDARDEQKLWGEFFEAAVISGLAPLRVGDPKAAEVFLEAARRADFYQKFLQGRLEVEFSRLPADRWTIRYVGHEAVLTYRDGRAIISRTPASAGQLISIEIGRFLNQLLEPVDQKSGEPAPRAAEALEALDGGLEALLAIAENNGYVFHLSVNLNLLDSQLDLYRTAAALAEGRAPEPTFVHLLDELVGKKLFVVDDIRSWPAGSYGAAELGGPVGLEADVRNLDLYLFNLKNSADAHDRELFREITERFKRLTSCEFDVALSPRPVPPPDAATAIYGLTLRVIRGSESDRTEVPIGYAGAGIWELLVLSGLLAGKGRFLVFDEPALNLHPSRQRRFLQELRDCIGSGRFQAVLITHSPYLVPAESGEDFSRIVRFVLEDGRTRRQRPSMPAVIRGLALRHFSQFGDARSFLFARGVVLVEGDLECGAISGWLRKGVEAGRSPEDLDIVLYSVGGDGNFGPFIRLLEGWGIPWAVICDGKALDPNNPNWVFGQLEEAAPQDLPPELERFKAEGQNLRPDKKNKLFETIKSTAERCGIFTLSAGFSGKGEDFADFLKSRFPGEWNEIQAEKLRSQFLQGVALAERTDCPEEVKAVYKKILEHFQPGRQRPPEARSQERDRSGGDPAGPSEAAENDSGRLRGATPGKFGLVLLGALLGLPLLTGPAVVAGWEIAGLIGMSAALVFTLIADFAGWWFGDRIVRAVTRARELPDEQAPWLHNLVGRLADRVGIPKPRLWLIDVPWPNVIATGRDTAHGAIAVTAGLLNLVDRADLDGLVAHGLVHIRRRTVLIGSTAAAAVGLVTYLGQLTLGLGGILGLAGLLVQLRVCRALVFGADVEAARLAGDPRSLARTLERLAAAYPAGWVGEGLLSRLSPIPSVRVRTRRLDRMAADWAEE